MANNENNGYFNPIDVRSEDEHKELLKKWENFGLLNSGLMDALLAMTPEEITSLVTILSCESISDVEDTLNKYGIINNFVNGNLTIDCGGIDLDKFGIVKGIINDELEVVYNIDDLPEVVDGDDKTSEAEVTDDDDWED